MKQLAINVLEDYKSYKKGAFYKLEGDLILLSGVNGSGKSQLLKIIANNTEEKISRRVIQTNNCNDVELESILLLSFRDNINLGNDFGAFSINYKKNSEGQAWNFYSQNIKYDQYDYKNKMRYKKFKENSLIYDGNGIKKASWRSIISLVELLKTNFEEEKIFTLSKDELEGILPAHFIWRDENDIIQQIGNIFYVACCERADKKMKCGETTEVFNNEEWLKTAPWTILNELFEELNFKYRFKSDYIFRIPNMEENPKLRMGEEIRTLLDLSDGEKAILKLALIALDEEISGDINLVLFDEYDAPLNPSLTDAFYHVINKFYIRKGIQVIVTTHSPATISMAPEYAHFYEIFSQENDSPKLINVNQYDYEEIRVANSGFYNKIKNQEKRIEELEISNKLNGNLLLVEDKYDQIYKIAYLKIKDIEEINENNFEQLFENVANFSIHGGFASGGLYNVLNCDNISRDENNKVICLFDYDGEGFEKFKKTLKLKKNDKKVYGDKQGEIRTGLFIKHCEIDRYAMLLPIPERLEKYVHEKSSSYCFVEVESLLAEEYLKTNSKAEIVAKGLLDFYKMNDDFKKIFWKDLFSVDKKYFEDFRPLFETIEELFAENKIE